MKTKKLVVLIIILVLFSFRGCDCDNPIKPKNNPPVITSLIANPTKVNPSSSSLIVCTANDPDKDDLAYIWKSISGSVTGSRDSVLWRAPNIEGLYFVSCEVLDGRGGKDLDSVQIEVKQTISTDGLIAFYPFNGNANDESGNGNNGTVVGASLSSDRFNNSESAYIFDGLDDYIDIGLLSELNGALEISISIWIMKFSADRYEGFVGRWNTDSKPNNVLLLYNNEQSWVNYPIFDLQFDDESIGWAEAKNKAPIGEWFHLAGVWRSSDGFIGIYMNGTLENSNFYGQGKSLYYLDTYTTRIGHWGFPEQGGECFFLGKLDDIRIYKRALTEEEIKSLYNEIPYSINSLKSNLP